MVKSKHVLTRFLYLGQARQLLELLINSGKVNTPAKVAKSDVQPLHLAAEHGIYKAN